MVDLEDLAWQLCWLDQCFSKSSVSLYPLTKVQLTLLIQNKWELSWACLAIDGMLNWCILPWLHVMSNKNDEEDIWNWSFMCDQCKVSVVPYTHCIILHLYPHSNMSGCLHIYLLNMDKYTFYIQLWILHFKGPHSVLYWVLSTLSTTPWMLREPPPWCKWRPCLSILRRFSFLVCHVTAHCALMDWKLRLICAHIIHVWNERFCERDSWKYWPLVCSFTCRG